MIDMDELYEYENQPCTDMADELEMLEITHEIMAKEKEKTERERKQHVAESNDTDVYATQDAPAEQKQDNTVTSTEAPEKPKEEIEENAEAKTEVKAEQVKDKTGGGSSSDNSNATVVTGGNVNRETTYNKERNSNLYNTVINKIWFATIKESDRNTLERVRQIKKALSIFKTEEDLLSHINEYIDDGHTMYEETYFLIMVIFQYDVKFFRNYKARVLDHNTNSIYVKAVYDFIVSIPELKTSKENHS